MNRWRPTRVSWARSSRRRGSRPRRRRGRTTPADVETAAGRDAAGRGRVADVMTAAGCSLESSRRSRPRPHVRISISSWSCATRMRTQQHSRHFRARRKLVAPSGGCVLAHTEGASSMTDLHQLCHPVLPPQTRLGEMAKTLQTAYVVDFVGPRGERLRLGSGHSRPRHPAPPIR